MQYFYVCCFVAAAAISDATVIAAAATTTISLLVKYQRTTLFLFLEPNIAIVNESKVGQLSDMLYINI